MKEFYPGLKERQLPGGLGWAVEFITLTTHSGTHLDAPYRYHPTMDGGERALTIDEIPLEWCFNNGVVLDFRHKGDGERITVQDLEKELQRIQYEIRPLDIVLVQTGADAAWGTEEYLLKGAGMDRESTMFLTEKGVPPHRIIIGHSCGSADHEYHLNILDRGSYLGFDRFGLEVLAPDEQRIQSLVALLKKHREQRIVVSHDNVWCTRGKPFPEDLLAMMDPDTLFDPTHFHRNIIPRLLEEGVTREQIDAMLVDNPRRFFRGEL